MEASLYTVSNNMLINIETSIQLTTFYQQKFVQIFLNKLFGEEHIEKKNRFTLSSNSLKRDQRKYYSWKLSHMKKETLTSF